MEILNSIVELELIPPLLKSGTTIPAYKGGGKDPLDVNSYRGITSNSVISKVFAPFSVIILVEPPVFCIWHTTCIQHIKRSVLHA